MTLIQTEEQELLISMIKEHTQRDVLPHVAKLDAAGACPLSFFQPAFELGLHMLEIPQEYGGIGLDYQSTAMAFEELGKADAGYAITLVTTFVALRNVIAAGTPQQARLFADRVASGGLGAFLLTEPSAGSDPGAMTTRAVREGDEYVINGSKAWITNGSISEVYVLLAKTDSTAGNRGISCFLVEADRQGISVGDHEDKSGLRLSNTCTVSFTDVRIPADHLVGAEGGGFKIAMHSLDLSRPFMATIAVGIMQRALDEAVHYACTRQQFSQPIISFQLVAKMLADMAAQTEAARCLVNNTMRMIDAGLPVQKEGAITKMIVTDMLQSVTSDAVQVFGGNGYTKGFPVEKLMRDAKVFQIMEGTNQIQAITIGRCLAREYA